MQIIEITCGLESEETHVDFMRKFTRLSFKMQKSPLALLFTFLIIRSNITRCLSEKLYSSEELLAE